jgi:hypothetical protein
MANQMTSLSSAILFMPTMQLTEVFDFDWSYFKTRIAINKKKIVVQIVIRILQANSTRSAYHISSLLNIILYLIGFLF